MCEDCSEKGATEEDSERCVKTAERRGPQKRREVCEDCSERGPQKRARGV